LASLYASRVAVGILRENGKAMRSTNTSWLALGLLVLTTAGCSAPDVQEPPAPEEPAANSQPTPAPVTESDPCAVGKSGNIWVLAEEDGCIEPWPLTSTSGVLTCDPLGENLGVITWNPDENPLEAYAVNGMALGQGYPEIDEIWKDSPDGEGAPKVNIGPLIDAGLSLCGQ
jgi:hypothetical protein